MEQCTEKRTLNSRVDQWPMLMWRRKPMRQLCDVIDSNVINSHRLQKTCERLAVSVEPESAYAQLMPSSLVVRWPGAMLWGCSCAFVMDCILIWRVKINDEWSIGFGQHKLPTRHYFFKEGLKCYKIRRENCILFNVPTMRLHYKDDQMPKWLLCCPNWSHFLPNEKEKMMKTSARLAA